MSKVFARELNRPVYAIDTRNHGDSSHDPRHDYTALAEDVELFLQEHKLENSTLIGHSMGAKTAMTIALRHKVPIGSLIPIDNAPVDAALKSDFGKYVQGMKRIEEAKCKKQSDADAVLADYEESLPIRQFLLTNLVRDPETGTQKFRIPIKYLSAALDNMADFPFKDPEEARYNGPTLMVRGTKSRYVADEMLPTIGRFFPRFQLADIEAGHWVVSEKPEEFRKALSAALPLAYAQTQSNETVLGVYMFHRHGDRTAKSTPPSNLTDLGYQEVYTSGQYYRSRYIASDATYRINGINADVVKQSQIAVSAPADTVLQNSAMGFLQSLYPPVGSGLDTDTLKNGTVITAPMDGYQLIPISLVTSGSGSEDNGWLQSASGCAQATISSNNFFTSAEYMSLLNSTHGLYQSVLPTINGTFNSSTATFKNAYTVWDLINVAEIHNATFDPTNIVTSDIFQQLSELSNMHEWGLAYNSSDEIRAIAGMTLAAQVQQFLNGTITSAGKQKIGIQFGAYGTFSSFFGLAIPNIETTEPALMGVADYASALTFEMFTNSSTAVSSNSYPGEDEIYVRMLFHNGTTSNISEPEVYPMFGSGQEVVSWNDFNAGLNKFAVGTTEQWCTACGNFTGSCAAYAPAGSSGSSSNSQAASGGKAGNGLSPVVNGVIGAMVTLAVVLGLEALVMLLGGFRVVSKKRLAQGAAGSPSTSVGAGAKA
ncbi:hypothetical protein B0A55_07724 [Friedmanniomyces simplex]|uniref:AB hydrolase-1 domain-containing protein n=1 Tax=Friedmanniomyces simplex TaxID=329884 RepID=A0A4U0WYH6_9PEZI|nr:hypothetical protein B0A55_07724 [Friedmanniomyces simplex]